MAQLDDTLKLVVDGREWAGWVAVRVTRGIERMPSDFAVTVTERYPGQPGINIQPGQPVRVLAGDDLLITGYVDDYAPSVDPAGHTVEITGRGKCQDLVDCSAMFNGMQLAESTALGIAQVVSKPFGVTVTAPDGPGEVITAFNSVLTETPFQIIERVIRYSGLLAFEGTDGNLVLAHAGTSEMASGFAEGVNCQAFKVRYSMAQRFSEITAVISAIDRIWQTGAHPPGAIGLSQDNDIFTLHETDLMAHVARGERIGRYRPRLIISEQGSASLKLAEQRVKWEMARRYGRSQAVTVTCDSWRDSAGKLWEPNTLARLHLPSVKLPDKTWLISEVTFSKDAERGTVADVTLMPKNAFLPEPLILYPFDAQVQQALQESAGPALGSKGPGGALGHA